MFVFSNCPLAKGDERSGGDSWFFSFPRNHNTPIFR
jgi:hypothetical protein